MIPVSIARKRIKSAFAIDRYTLAAVAERLAALVSDVAELSNARIEGAILATLRHSENYGKQAEGFQRYGSAYRDIKDAANARNRQRIVRL